MKPPWIDQGWSLVAGALTNRGIHPPPTTSRPSLPPRCAAAPSTAFASPRPAATPPAIAGFQSLSLFLSSPSSTRVRKRVARLAAYPPHVHPRQPSRSRSLSVSPFLPSSEADLPRGRPTPPSTTTLPTPPSRRRAENTEPPPHRSPGALPYAATAITFAGKSSEAVREPGLTLQGVVRTANLSSSSSTFFPSFPTFSFVLAGEERFFRAIDKII